MKLRLLAHSLVLALFVTATLLTAIVAPTKAGAARMDAEAMAEMQGDMSCCPSDRQAKQPDCASDCPARGFCLTKCVSSEPALAVSTMKLPVLSDLCPAGDDARPASRPFEPPTRPPRMNDIAGA